MSVSGLQAFKYLSSRSAESLPRTAIAEFVTAAKVLCAWFVRPHPVMYAMKAAALLAFTPVWPSCRVFRCSQPLDLTPSDLVQLINLRPTTPVEAHVVWLLPI